MATVNKFVAETHRIKAGSNFDGTAPAADSADNKKQVLVYAPATAGGLFKCPRNRDESTKIPSDPRADQITRRVSKIQIKFGGQSAWSLFIVDETGVDVLILTGTTETDLVGTDKFDLAPGEDLKLTTTGASTAMVATVFYEAYTVR